MKRITSPTNSDMGSRIAIRMDHQTFNLLQKHLKDDPRVEQFAMALYRPLKSAGGTILLVEMLVLPEKHELAMQSAGGVSPKKDFQAAVYLIAKETGLGILDIHTHPHQSVPRFSYIDQAESHRNSQYINRLFNPNQSLAMLVFGNDITGHDVVVFDPSINAFREITQLQIVGQQGEVHQTGQPYTDSKIAEQFDRHQRIGWWNQTVLQRQNIVVVGAGGTGAYVLQMLAAMGAAKEGFLAAIDHDKVELTNLPRIPYAARTDCGKPKIQVAGEMVGRVAPETRFYGLACKVQNEPAQALLNDATVIIGCGDNDGVRKIINNAAVQSKALLIDCGCGIESGAEAGGQVRVVVPGQSACLVCGEGFDASEAALDLADEEEQKLRARHGYVRGSDAPPTPSIGILNAFTANMAIQQLIAHLHDSLVKRHDIFSYNFMTGSTMSVSAPRDPSCPCCGEPRQGNETIAADIETVNTESIMQPSPAKADKEDDECEPAEAIVSIPLAICQRESNRTNHQSNHLTNHSTNHEPQEEGGNHATHETDAGGDPAGDRSEQIPADSYTRSGCPIVADCQAHSL